MKLYFQNIVDDISFETLPAKWQGFDFQQDAFKNALRGLWLYFVDKKSNKEDLLRLYQNNGLEEKSDYNLSRERKTAKYLLDYPDDYSVIDNKISFAHFIKLECAPAFGQNL